MRYQRVSHLPLFNSEPLPLPLTFQTLDWIEKFLLCDANIGDDSSIFVRSYHILDQCLKIVDNEVNWADAKKFCDETYQVVLKTNIRIY